MPTPASTEHSTMSCVSPPPQGGGGSELDEDEPHSPIRPQNLFGADNEDAANDDIIIQYNNNNNIIIICIYITTPLSP